MPTHIHKTVSCAPSRRDGQCEAAPPAEAVDRVELVAELLDWAQIAALNVVLDKNLISRVTEFTETKQSLIDTFFPRHFDAGKIERKFRLLGQTLLSHRKSNGAKVDPSLYVVDAELDRYIMT